MMEFNCSMCISKFKSEIDLNTHYLFEHNTFRGFCDNQKLIKLDLLIDELKIRFSRIPRKTIKGMMYGNHFYRDERFVYFFIKFMQHYSKPIKGLSLDKQNEILNHISFLNDDYAIMREFCVTFEIEWQPYYEPKKITVEQEKDIASWVIQP